MGTPACGGNAGWASPVHGDGQAAAIVPQRALFLAAVRRFGAARPARGALARLAAADRAGVAR